MFGSGKINFHKFILAVQQMLLVVQPMLLAHATPPTLPPIDIFCLVGGEVHEAVLVLHLNVKI